MEKEKGNNCSTYSSEKYHKEIIPYFQLQEIQQLVPQSQHQLAAPANISNY